MYPHERWWALQLAIVLICFALSMPTSAQCFPYPINIPIHNVTLSSGNIARGAELTIGHPPQKLALLPQWPLNNTLLYGTEGYCSDGIISTSIACETWRGGQYAFLSSDTRRQPPNPNPIDSSPPYPAIITYTDVFKINDNVTLDDFAVSVALSDFLQQGYRPMMALGLGRNSTILSSLQAGKQIASRVWSMFYGLTGANPNTQLDGALVLGGYDRAKVSGQGYTYELNESDSRCGTQMLVTIDDIIVHFPNGTDASIVKSTSNGSYPACIIPESTSLLTMAYEPYFEMFETVTETIINDRTFGQEYYTMLYSDGDTPFGGDMSIKIRDGPSVRVPNSQLVVPERYIDSTTGELTTNYSRSNLVINPLNTINLHDLAFLGRLFLSSAYLMVNQDRREFTMWVANPTIVQDLVGVDSTGEEVTTFCAHSTNSTGPKPPDQTQMLATPNRGLSPGAIAGIVVGAAAVVAIIIGTLLWRRLRSGNSDSDQPDPPIAAQGTSTIHSYYSGNPLGINHDLSKPGPGPGELHGTESIYGPVAIPGVELDRIEPPTPGRPRFELGS